MFIKFKEDYDGDWVADRLFDSQCGFLREDISNFSPPMVREDLSSRLFYEPLFTFFCDLFNESGLARVGTDSGAYKVEYNNAIKVGDNEIYIPGRRPDVFFRHYSEEIEASVCYISGKCRI